jgi:tRNA (guanine-N7-)-methyltransferase
MLFGAMVRPSQFHEQAEGVWTARLAQGQMEGRGLIVEYCAGNGSWIAYRAERDRAHQYVAVECKRYRVAKIWSKRQNHALDHLRVVLGEAAEFTKNQLSDGSVGKVFIHFPDPWPKRRHAKHRLMQPGFVRELARVLQPEGSVYFVTDSGEYVAETEAVFRANGEFEVGDVKPFEPAEDYGSSYFEGLWRSQGRPIYELLVTRR